MELPWPTITAASGGWLLTGAFVWAMITGRLVTRREADEYVKRAERAEDNMKTSIETLAGLTAVGKIQRRFAEQAIEQAESD